MNSSCASYSKLLIAPKIIPYELFLDFEALPSSHNASYHILLEMIQYKHNY